MKLQYFIPILFVLITIDTFGFWPFSKKPKLSVKLADGHSAPCEKIDSNRYVCLEENKSYFIAVENDDYITYEMDFQKPDIFEQIKAVEIQSIQDHDQVVAAFKKSEKSLRFSSWRDVAFYNALLMSLMLDKKNLSKEFQTRIDQVMTHAQNNLQQLREKFYSPEITVNQTISHPVTCRQLKSSDDNICMIYKCDSPEADNLYFISNNDPTNLNRFFLRPTGDSFQKTDDVWDYSIGNDKTLLANQYENLLYNPYNPTSSMGNYSQNLRSNLPISFMMKDDFDARVFDLGVQRLFQIAAAHCDENEISLLKQSYDQVNVELGKSPVYQIVEVFGKFLSSRFVNTPLFLPQSKCLKDGVYYNSQDSYQTSQNFTPKMEGRVITMSEASELFKKQAARKDIAWNYKRDGCYARAELMADDFKKQGIAVGKAWVKGDLIANENSGDEVEWNYHVAPFVMVDMGQGRVEKVVLDPSLMSGPVTAKDWALKMSSHVQGNIEETEFPFPENSALYRRISLSFSSTDFYQPDQSLQLSEKDVDKMAKAKMQEYKEY